MFFCMWNIRYIKQNIKKPVIVVYEFYLSVYETSGLYVDVF